MTRTFEVPNALWALLVGAGVGLLCLVSPFIPLAIILGGGFALAMLRKPILMAYLLIGAVVFLSGMPRGHLIPLFIPNEPVLVLVAGISYFVVIMRADNAPVAKPVLLAIVIFALGTAIIPLVAYKLRGYPLTTSEIFNLAAPLQYLVILWLFASLPRTDAERHNIIQWMLFCASVVSFIGLLEAMNVGFVSNLLNRWYPSWHIDEAYGEGRVTSVLGAWNSLGNFLLINLILVLALQNYKRSRLQNLNTIAALTLSTACLLASGSYASLIGLIISIVIIKWYDRRGLKVILRLGVILVIGVIILYPLIQARLEYQFREGGLVPETLAYRFEVWQKVYIPMINRNPVWGISPTFLGVASWGWAESQYLYLMFRSGVISLVSHLLFVFILMRWSRKRIHTLQGLDRSLAIALYAILISFTIMGLTNEVFTGSGVVEYIWIIIGLMALERPQAVRTLILRRPPALPDGQPAY